MTEAAIIGAGVAGLVVANELVDAGYAVTVIDRASSAGPEQCSWWAGGMLAPWCERESAEQAVVDLGIEAADWWQAAGVDVTRNGTLVLAPPRDQRELTRFGRRTTGFETVDAHRVAALEPDLAGRFRSGLFFGQEAHIDPRKALAVLRDRLKSRGGEVQFDRQEMPRADIVIDCRGLAARDRLTDLRGVKGEMLLLRTSEISLSRPVRLLHPRYPIYILPRGEGLFMLGATMIESDDRSRITARSMLELLGAAYALHPSFGEAEVVEIGVDARPAFPDNLPRVEHLEGRIYVNGLFRHGFLLAPAMAKRALGLVHEIAGVRAAS